MSRRARRQPDAPKPARVPAEGRAGCAAAVVLSGLVLACLGVFAVTPTSCTFLFWLSRGDSIRTELEVTEIGHGDGAVVFGIVAATGEEIRCNRVPAELAKFLSSGDPTSTVMTFEKVRGKVVPIWYARDHRSSFSSDRVQYVSEFPTLPSAGLVLGIAAVNLSIFAAGVGLVVFGARRINAPAARARQP